MVRIKVRLKVELFLTFFTENKENEQLIRYLPRISRKVTSY